MSMFISDHITSEYQRFAIYFDSNGNSWTLNSTIYGEIYQLSWQISCNICIKEYVIKFVT